MSIMKSIKTKWNEQMKSIERQHNETKWPKWPKWNRSKWNSMRRYEMIWGDSTRVKGNEMRRPEETQMKWSKWNKIKKLKAIRSIKMKWTKATHIDPDETKRVNKSEFTSDEELDWHFRFTKARADAADEPEWDVSWWGAVRSEVVFRCDREQSRLPRRRVRRRHSLKVNRSWMQTWLHLWWKSDLSDPIGVSTREVGSRSWIQNPVRFEAERPMTNSDLVSRLGIWNNVTFPSWTFADCRPMRTFHSAQSWALLNACRTTVVPWSFGRWDTRATIWSPVIQLFNSSSALPRPNSPENPNHDRGEWDVRLRRSPKHPTQRGDSYDRSKSVPDSAKADKFYHFETHLNQNRSASKCIISEFFLVARAQPESEEGVLEDQIQNNHIPTRSLASFAQS